MRPFLLVTVFGWVALIALSFILSGQIEGPRNIDTGFRRLDVLFKWQIIAFIVAIAATITAWRDRTLSRRLRMLGFAPLAITILVLSGIMLFTVHYNPPLPEPGVPRTPTAPAATNSG